PQRTAFQLKPHRLLRKPLGQQVLRKPLQNKPQQLLNLVETLCLPVLLTTRRSPPPSIRRKAASRRYVVSVRRPVAYSASSLCTRRTSGLRKRKKRKSKPRW